MMRRNTRFGTWLGALLLLGAAGCADLTQPNLDQADRERVLATPDDVESLIGSSFLSAWDATSGFANNDYDPAQNAQMSAASFEHSPMAANFGMVERSALPRLPIINTTADGFALQYGAGWYGSYRAIRAAVDGLERIADGVVIGDAARTARAQAFATFVQGYAHGNLALLYDSAFVVEVGGDPAALAFQPYGEVMTAALGFLDEAIALSEANTFELPPTWMAGNAVTNDQLAALAHSLKARFRAQVARTPDERAAVDWDAVIADVDAGITSDFSLLHDDTQWQHVLQVYFSFFGAWQQTSMFVLGMADQSGAYQTWMSTPVSDRTPFLLITPDERFPQGATVALQTANPGLYIEYIGTGGHVRSDRGTWRWSFYGDNRFEEYYAAGWLGEIPMVPYAEMRLLEAEGLYRNGDLDGAADLINVTRVANGGLQPTDAAGANADCVPKLPNGSCGSLLEMLKWEKRLETWGQVFGGWFFDSRGWGDLAQGTFVHYPVPARELLVLGKPLYSFGGSLPGSAPVGTYGY